MASGVDPELREHRVPAHGSPLGLPCLDRPGMSVGTDQRPAVYQGGEICLTLTDQRGQALAKAGASEPSERRDLRRLALDRVQSHPISLRQHFELGAMPSGYVVGWVVERLEGVAPGAVAVWNRDEQPPTRSQTLDRRLNQLAHVRQMLEGLEGADGVERAGLAIRKFGDRNRMRLDAPGRSWEIAFWFGSKPTTRPTEPSMRRRKRLARTRPR
jgi:hypothetical protein